VLQYCPFLPYVVFSQSIGFTIPNGVSHIGLSYAQINLPTTTCSNVQSCLCFLWSQIFLLRFGSTCAHQLFLSALLLDYLSYIVLPVLSGTGGCSFPLFNFLINYTISLSWRNHVSFHWMNKLLCCWRTYDVHSMNIAAYTFPFGFYWWNVAKPHCRLGELNFWVHPGDCRLLSWLFLSNPDHTDSWLIWILFFEYAC